MWSDADKVSMLAGVRLDPETFTLPHSPHVDLHWGVGVPADSIFSCLAATLQIPTSIFEPLLDGGQRLSVGGQLPLVGKLQVNPEQQMTWPYCTGCRVRCRPPFLLGASLGWGGSATCSENGGKGIVL